jgi:isopentenyl diphosphate isomerase/L-lactate dehydrogenase-like FMN-dependent dehydrogenase
VLFGKVYDVTSFLDAHPGGPASILKCAGRDATEEFDPVHPPGTLEDHLHVIKYLGEFDSKSSPQKKMASSSISENPNPLPSDIFVPQNIDQCLNLTEIERLATRKITKRAWSYYFSGGDDLISKNYNGLVYRKILFRPRVFIDCTRCFLQTTLLQGSLSLKLPIYISPAAQARLCHPSGEGGIAQACANFGALHIISNNASMTPEQIVEASPETTFGFQLYVQRDISKSEALLARLRKLPQIKFICLTLDQPVAGKREHDERFTLSEMNAAPITENRPQDAKMREYNAAGGIGKAMFAGTAMDLTWHKTLDWLTKHVGNKSIILKGIQTHEDAYIASTFAPTVRGIILSNHGGRGLDTAPPAVHTLLEIRKYCPEVPNKIEIWVDGGIKRGTDVVKALCLGAKAVGLGRPALWALGAGGTEGVEKMLGILKAETKTCMRLLGVERVDQLGLQYVSTVF